MAYELIETIEVGAGGATSIEFTSIPQDGVDLLCVISGRGTQESPYSPVGVFLSGDLTTTNYNTRSLFGNTTSSGQVLSTSGNFRPFFQIPAADTTSNTFGNAQILISNYSSTSAKSMSFDSVTESNLSTSVAGGEVNLAILASTHTTSSATSSIQLNILVGNFVQYSTASLYKIY